MEIPGSMKIGFGRNTSYAKRMQLHESPRNVPHAQSSVLWDLEEYELDQILH